MTHLLQSQLGFRTYTTLTISYCTAVVLLTFPYLLSWNQLSLHCMNGTLYTVNGLEINYGKTEAILLYKNGDRSAKDEGFSVQVHGNKVTISEPLRYLGVWLDHQLDFSDHYDNVMAKVSSLAGAFRRLKRFLSFDQLTQLLKTSILSTIDYALPIWAILDKDKLQQIQNKINRILLDFRRRDTFCTKKIGQKRVIYEFDMLERSNILSVNERVQYYCSLVIFKFLRQIDNDSFVNK